MPVTRPRFTIERLRTLILIGGVVLVAAIGLFLAAGRWKLQRTLRDLPGKLGVDIQQSANGVDYTQSRKGKTLFKIHAARAVQMKSGGKTLLHDVRIDLYGEDGTRADTIAGSEFEYDPREGIAHAAGAVEITLMRPGIKPAIAQLKPGAQLPALKPLGTAALVDNQIHVKTSGLLFNQKTGIATTDQRVDFALRQGSGNAVGATYNSAQGQLVLDHAVELRAERGAARLGSEAVTVHASHAEFARDRQLCTLTQATAATANSTAQAAIAQLFFRDDGSVLHLDGSGGVDLRTGSGAHLTAPHGTLDFDENNHPRTGLLDGGTQMELNRADRQMQGSAQSARLLFDGQGEIRHAHLEQAVSFHSTQQLRLAKGAPSEATRTWHSQSADITFAPGPSRPAVEKASTTTNPVLQNRTRPRVEARTIQGFGGVVITAETRTGSQSLPSRLSADTVTAELASGGAITSLVGSGHASFEQRNAQGIRQSSSSDQLDVGFNPLQSKAAGKQEPSASPQPASQIAVMHQSGHVVLVQDPPPSRSGHTNQTAMRATAERADYDGATQMLHLWGAPRIQDGPVEMTANQIDFARATGDAFAHGNVKASWSSENAPGPGGTVGPSAGGLSTAGLGASGPVHAIAAEAELRQSTNEVVFQGAAPSVQGELAIQPRLWQGANSVSAPRITLSRQRQTLVALGSGPANPVRTILLSNFTDPSAKPAMANHPAGPSVIRIASGDLRFSEAEHLAVFHSGPAGLVTAQTTQDTGNATVNAQEAEVRLLPTRMHTAVPTTQSSGGVDQMTARGHVSVDWPGRKGTGEKLVYQGEDGSFTLTGTAAAPPRMTDPARGTITGSALIFHSRDDSVTVEGDGAKTVTETRTPPRSHKQP